MISTIIFPSSFNDLHKIDEDMEQEYQAVLETGLFTTILFGYDEWFNYGQLHLFPIPESEIHAVYRGWMMKPEQYRDFYTEALKSNIHPDMYAYFHLFPNVYSKLSGDTARIMTFPLYTKIDVEQVKSVFSRFMVKDFVKSVKGTEFPSYFDQNITQTEFDRWMDVFYDYRGSLLTGGICIKEFLNLKKYGDCTNEYRVYYINHEIATVCRNSLQPDYTPEPPLSLIEKYRYLESIFYTIDFAELEDGSWKIMEAGDGCVSGLSDGQNYQAFFRALYQCFL